VVSNSYGLAFGRVLWTGIRCDGSESSLGDCSSGDRRSKDDAAAAPDCAHSSNHVAVSCQQCHTVVRRYRRNPLLTHNANTDNTNSSGDYSYQSFISTFINVRQSYCARYWYRLDAVCLSVCPSHTGIVSKRLNLSSNYLHFAPLF